MRSKHLLPVLALTIMVALTSCSGTAATTSASPNETDAETSYTTESQTQEPTTSSADNQTETNESPEKILELIKPEQAKELLDSDQEILLLDVRTQAEYDAVHIPGSTLIPVEELSGRISEISEWQNKTVIVYCRSGRRSAIAAKTLADAGFSIVYDLGGIQNWPYETES